MSILEGLAAEFGAVEHDDIPADVRRAARHCILDWYGCAIAGQDEPLTVILRDELLDGSGGPCRIVGRDATTTLLNAALINGAAGHALDFDDTNLTMSGHPTVPVLPAVLALADVLGASGRRDRHRARRRDGGGDPPQRRAGWRPLPPRLAHDRHARRRRCCGGVLRG